MKERSKVNSADKTQELAERFVYNNDDSVFFDCISMMECGIRNYIKDFLKSRNVPRLMTFVDEVYNMTVDSVYDNARKYYSKDKGKFTTWVYFVARRNCINTIRPYIKNKFYVVSPDLNDIESNNFEDDAEIGRYKLEKNSDEDKVYGYTIDGENRLCDYNEVMDDIVACLYSCIYSLNDDTDVKKRDKEILRYLYIEKKTMQETADIMGVKICVVKNAVTFKKEEILKVFKEKYKDLYNIIESENMFNFKKHKEAA